MEIKKLIPGFAILLAVAACHPQNTTDTPSSDNPEEQQQNTSISGELKPATNISLMEATVNATASFEGHNVLVELYYAPGILSAEEVAARGEQVAGDNQNSGQPFSRRLTGLKIGTDYSCVLKVTDMADGTSFLSEVQTFRTCGVTFTLTTSVSQTGQVSASASYTTDAPDRTFSVKGAFRWSESYEKAEDIAKHDSAVNVSWNGKTLSADDFYTGATAVSPKTIRVVFDFTFTEYSTKPTYEQTLYTEVRTLYVQPQPYKM